MRNRIAHAAIVTRFVKGGQATEALLNYHGSRARGGAGMIVTEPIAMISANRDPGRLRAYDDQGKASLENTRMKPKASTSSGTAIGSSVRIRAAVRTPRRAAQWIA